VKGIQTTPALSNRVLIPLRGRFVSELPKNVDLALPAPDILTTHDPLKSTIYIDGLPSDMGVLDRCQPDQ
jgi:hypothetical protein